MEDTELVTRARRGDKVAFEALVARHRDSAYRTASLVSGTSDVDDVVQEAFLKAFAMLDQLREGHAFRGWFLKTVANEARAHLRSAARRSALAAKTAQHDVASPSPEAHAIDAEQRRLLIDAIAELRPEERAVIGYRYFRGLSEAETALLLRCPPGTVKSRLARAMGRLRANQLLAQFLDEMPRRKEVTMEATRTNFDAALERAWEALGEGKLDPLSKLLGDGTTWWIGGRSVLAGEYRGRDNVLGYFRELIERSGGTYTTGGVDVSSTAYHSFLCYLSTATINATTLSWHETVVLHRDGDVLGDCFVYFYDQYEFDQFWSSAPQRVTT